jgi:hypothetical protein
MSPQPILAMAFCIRGFIPGNQFPKRLSLTAGFSLGGIDGIIRIKAQAGDGDMVTLPAVQSRKLEPDRTEVAGTFECASRTERFANLWDN